MPRKSAEERFWAKVNKGDACWNWTGCITPAGYGLISVRGRLISTHRFSYQIHHGSIPEGKLVCHTCDNRSCVNPSHLWLGSDRDNTRDMIAKGRRVIISGDAFCLTKVTDAQVQEIRALYASGSYRQYEIAAMYGINRTHVCNIVNRKAR